MKKQDIYKQEYEKITKLFQNVENNQKELAQGLIEDAAFLYAENHELKNLMKDTGTIKIHPTNKNLQKSTETGKQYLKNVNNYSIVIKALYSILQKSVVEEEDGFDKFMEEMKGR